MNIQTQPAIQYAAQYPTKYPSPIIPRMAEYQYTLVVEHSDYAENPREWGSMSTFVSFGNSCYGSDETHNDPEQYLIELVGQYDEGFEQRFIDKDVGPSLSTLMELAEEHYVIMPVCKYEHSGVAYSTSAYSCQWDSGQMGLIYVAKDQLREVYGWKRITSKRRKQVEEMMTSEITVFSQWANGNVYSFQLYYHDVEESYDSVEAQDSCSGFYHDWQPDSLEELRECGIADYLPDECLNDLVIVFKHG